MKTFVAFVLSCFVCPALFSKQKQPLYRTGLTIVGRSSSSCPIFVGGVDKDSPAEKAGIQIGDQLVAVDGTAINSVETGSAHLSSRTASPVTIELKRNDKPYRVTVQREANDVLWSRVSKQTTDTGMIVNVGATDAEIAYVHSVKEAVQNANDLITIFPRHYPANKQLYYLGFEIFVWDNKNQLTVGGIEQGPASRAGIRWGDRILDVNGVYPRNKSVVELESLFSSMKPTSMALTIERAGQQKKFSIQLEQATAVLRENHWQVVNDKLVPDWVPQKYLSCF